MSQPTIKAIETKYKGYRFRSRLEARWAVFFDALKMEWRYEDEGFRLASGLYLPDFRIKPKWGGDFFVEIKGGEPSHQEKLLCFELACDSKCEVLLLCGNIGTEETTDKSGDYGGHHCSFESTTFSGYRTQHAWGRDDVHFAIRLPAYLHKEGVDLANLLPAWLIDGDRQEEYVRQIIELDREFYLRTRKKEHDGWKYGVTSRAFLNQGRPDENNPFLWKHNRRDAELIEALNTARSARFEHGESS